MPHLALDCMGGDHGPAPAVAGAGRALATDPTLVLTLVGDQAQLDPLAQAARLDAGRVRYCHTAGVIGMTEKPVEAFRKKPDNSIAQSWKLVATKQADGLVSAGNTGAVVAGGVFLKRYLKHVRKPAIAALMPTAKGRTVILDVGANVFPKPSHLLQYGVMGAACATVMLGVAEPTIGLMNVGEEEGKGHELANKTYELFRSAPLPGKFVGNVEGRDIHKGAVDVIVTDGFVGNVLLKQAEGLFEFMAQLVGRDVVGALAAERDIGMRALQKLVAKFHHTAAGGAPLLGVDGVCVIGHGASDETAFANALGVAARNVTMGLNAAIEAGLDRLPAAADE